MKGCLNQFQSSFNPHYIIKLEMEDQSTPNRKMINVNSEIQIKNKKNYLQLNH